MRIAVVGRGRWAAPTAGCSPSGARTWVSWMPGPIRSRRYAMTGFASQGCSASTSCVCRPPDRRRASSRRKGPGRTSWIVFTDSNATREAARAASHLLAPQGCAITFQNGIGNLEGAAGGAGDGTGARRLQHVQRPRGSARSRGDDPPRSDLDRRARRAAYQPPAAGGRGARTGGLRGPREGRRQHPDLDQVHPQQRDQRALRHYGAAPRRGRAPPGDGRPPGPRARRGVRPGAGRRSSRSTEAEVRAHDKGATAASSSAAPRCSSTSKRGAVPRSTRSTARSCASRASSASPPPATRPSTALLKGRELNAIRRRENPDLDYDAWEAEVRKEQEKEGGA